MTAFAHQLLNTLPEAQHGEDSGLLLAEIATNTRELLDLRDRDDQTCSDRTAKDLERQGRDLWNSCLRLVRQLDAQGTGQRQSKLLTRVRVLAFHMIAMGCENLNRQTGHDEMNAAYLFNLAMTTVRYCAQTDDLSPAGAIMQLGAGYLQKYKDMVHHGSADAAQSRVFKRAADYSIMRMALVCRGPFCCLDWTDI